MTQYDGDDASEACLIEGKTTINQITARIFNTHTSIAFTWLLMRSASPLMPCRRATLRAAVVASTATSALVAATSPRDRRLGTRTPASLADDGTNAAAATEAQMLHGAPGSTPMAINLRDLADGEARCVLCHAWTFAALEVWQPAVPSARKRGLLGAI